MASAPQTLTENSRYALQESKSSLQAQVITESVKVQTGDFGKPYVIRQPSWAKGPDG